MNLADAISDSIDVMASITIRGLDDGVKERLRVRAARHGLSMEQEARDILTGAVSQSEPEKRLGDSIVALFQPLGGIDLPEYPRHEGVRREPPSFD